MTMQIETGISPKGGAVPVWARILGALGVIWYGFGLMQMWLGFTLDVQGAVAAGTMSAEHGAAVAGTPMLIWLAFALASGAGLAGAALVFAGRWPMAAALFKLSLVMGVIYYVWVYALSGTGGARPTEELFIAAMVLGVTSGFAWLTARKAR